MKNTTALIGFAVLLIALIAVPATAGLTFVSSSPQTITEGDTFTITGTGATNGSVAVIAFGRNYFQIFAITPDSQGNYSFTLSPDKTQNFLSGQYAFVMVDPGADRQFEIAGTVAANGNITITDRGIPVADLGPVSGLGPGVQPAVEALQNAVGRSDVDDTVTPEYFFVELPFVNFTGTIDPATGQLAPAHGADGRLIFTGTTNMGTENTLTAEIYDLMTGTQVRSVPVSAIVPGTGAEPGINKVLNSWTFDLDPTGLAPGEYYANVGWQKEKACGHGTALFTIPNTGSTGRASGLLPVFKMVQTLFGRA